VGGGDREKLGVLRPLPGNHEERVGLKTSQDLFFVVCHQMTPANGAIANRHWLNSMPVENITHS
jgi:hypothetical protein